MTFDPKNLPFGPRRKTPSVLRDYLEQVANRKLVAYKTIRQHGGKRGESLYTHVLNGILLLEALRPHLGLSDKETQLLFTVFTVHDINKVPHYVGDRYDKVAIPDNFVEEIQRLGLDQFFPNYEPYLLDIVRIAREHSGHGGMLDLIVATESDIDDERLRKLLSLIRAIDIIDLSHTLEERSHKATFLSHLNDFVDDRQFGFYIHHLAEDRGSLSNLIHNALVSTFREMGLIPLLYYSDGVAYLLPRHQSITITETLRRTMSQRVASALNEMTGQGFNDFIKSGIQGIKVDPKCLELGISFSRIWDVIYSRVQTRSLKRDELLSKIVERTERSYSKNAAATPDVAATVRQWLDSPNQILPHHTERLRDGELIRTYYIFLKAHFANTLPDPWTHIYNLFNLPQEQRQRLAYFDALWDRPYVLVKDLPQDFETIYTFIENDGNHLLGQTEIEDDKTDLFNTYLARYALFGPIGQVKNIGGGSFTDHLQEYVANQHQQCVHCSTLFPTDRWMTNDVRSDITVQTFSNRLRGGPGEPKKYICRLCQLQFLVERLNYEEVRGEKTMYLHLFPYSFLPAPLLQALWEGIDELRTTDKAVHALWCRVEDMFLTNGPIDPRFAIETNSGKPHPYGMYLHRHRNTVGNRLIFPINPAGNNASSRFLFALWNALVLQRHFGLRVLLSESPVAPFIPDVDFYVDNVALSCRGLIEQNDYTEFADYQKATPGTLPLLWERAQNLFAIVRLVRTTSNRDEMLALVQSMASGPLHLFYVTEKLLEARVSDQKLNSPEWAEIRLSQQIFFHLKILALNKGGHFMAELSTHLQKLAEISWQGGLRGKSLKKNSLMTPLDEIFKKLNLRSATLDEAALQAVIAEDIFEYLERIADEQYAPGKRKMNAASEFVDTFFRDVLHGVYQNNLAKLLTEEKQLRSAFMFYMRQQIPAKQAEQTEVEVVAK
jgi:CRISPR-associated protein Csc3